MIAIVAGLDTGLAWELPFIAGALTYPLAILVALYYPAPLVSQGQAHRIFYLHAPAAWAALYAPLLASLCAAVYLRTRSQLADMFMHAAVRLGLVFALIVLITGPLWALTEWGAFWNWQDPRLTTFFILFLCLCGYFLVRTFSPDPGVAALHSTAPALLLTPVVLLTWFALNIFKADTHPTSVLGTMSPRIKSTFWINVLASHLFFLFLLRVSVRREFIRRMAGRLPAGGQESR